MLINTRQNQRWRGISTAAILLIAVIFGLGVTVTLRAQAVSGNIVGTITDASGAAVPNAAVSITDRDRGTVSQTTTNETGNYSQTHLLSGRYELRVNAPGFAPFMAQVVVQVDATTRVDAALKVGEAQSTITVTDETPLLKTDRADVSTTLTGSEVEKLPILDRNLTSLVLAVPGAQLNSWQHAAAENPQQGFQINVNGQAFTSNGFLLDGTENESAILGIAVINPNLDSLQDFKITTSNYDAEFGSVSGALLQATTKSGTNQIHGTLFEFLRNDIFNASDHFTSLKPPLRWNQFGGSIGGPIRKDKLFAFFDYQGTRRSDGGSLIATVPTAAERNGDLRAQLGDYICAGGGTSAGPCANPAMVTTTENLQVPARAGMVFDPNSGDPATGVGRRVFSTNGQVNVIPVAAPMQKILGYLPLPNNGTDIFNNYIAGLSQKFNVDQYDGRVDYVLNEKTHLFSRYTIADFNRQSPGAFGDEAGGPSPFGFAGQALDRNQSAAAGFDHAFSPTLITDFRMGFYRYRIRTQPQGVGTTPATDAGLPGLNTGTPETSGMPAFYVNGDGGFNFGYALGVNQCNCPLKQTENHFQWVNNWTKELGNHSIKFGADIRRAQQQRVPSDSHRSGEISFNSSTTGDPTLDALANGSATTGSALGSYLLGLPSSFARYFTPAGLYPGLRQTRLFFFAQDTWRATPKLTIAYGLRWEDYLPQTAAKPGGAGTFDPSTGDVLVAGWGTVPSNVGIKPYNGAFAPRIGLSYQLTPKTVGRIGYGKSYNPAGLGSIFGQGFDYDPPITLPQSVTQNGPYNPVFDLLNGPPGVPAPVIPDSGRYPLPNNLSVYYIVNPPDSYRIPQVDFWNATVQRQLRSDLTLEAAYVGNVGRHLYENPNINQAVPGPGSYDSRRPFYNLYGLEQGLYAVCNCGTSNYNALQVKLQKRFSHGLDFLLTYTYSRALSAVEAGGGGWDNNYDIAASYGPMNSDHTHAVTLTHHWDLPFGKNQRWTLGGSRALDLIAGGWRFSGVTTILSGAPFSATVSNAPLLNTDFNGVRADIIGNPSVSNPNSNLWFNPAAYTAPQQAYRDGTSSRNSLRGPGMFAANWALAKAFAITEKKELEVRWETFNTFNHPNLANPASTIDESGAGQITATAVPMRQMQLGLHFSF
jgi:hypothetical protein